MFLNTYEGEEFNFSTIFDGSSIEFFDLRYEAGKAV